MNPIEPSLHVGVMHEGAISTTIGLQGIPVLAETLAVGHLLQIARATGARLHLAQLSCAESVHLVAKAKADGIPVTADVALQNLLYTDTDVEYFNSMFHCQPPLRAQQDRQTLLEAVRNGTIDAITSCHRPHEAAAKQMPFAETAPGMSSIELLLPGALRLADSGELPLKDFIRAMTEGPARILGLERPCIKEQGVANLCLFDPQATWTVTEDSLASAGKNSPEMGSEIKGQVEVTLYRGRPSHRR
jgi:dihydroorotase